MCTVAQIKFPASVAKTNDGVTEYDKGDDTLELASKSSFSPPFETPAQLVPSLSNTVSNSTCQPYRICSKECNCECGDVLLHRNP